MPEDEPVAVDSNSVVTGVEDQADRDDRRDAERTRKRREELRRSSRAVQRDLPRPLDANPAIMRPTGLNHPPLTELQKVQMFFLCPLLRCYTLLFILPALTWLASYLLACQLPLGLPAPSWLASSLLACQLPLGLLIHTWLSDSHMACRALTSLVGFSYQLSLCLPISLSLLTLTSLAGSLLACQLPLGLPAPSWLASSLLAC